MAETNERIYLVLFPHQEAQIKVWCWGSCGHGHIGATDMGLSLAVACSHEDCPHLDKVMDTPVGLHNSGADAYVRKLNDLPSEQPPTSPARKGSDRL